MAAEKKRKSSSESLGGKSTVFRNVTLSYLQPSDEKEMAERMSGILSEGVYAHLKKRGLLGGKQGKKG